MATRSRIGDVLVAQGLINRELAEAIDAERARVKTRFLSAAVLIGALKEERALQWLARHLGVPAVDVGRVPVPGDVLARVPREVAARESILPLRVDGRSLLLAMVTPDDRHVIDEASFVTGLSVVPHAALHFRMAGALERLYGKVAAPTSVVVEEVPVVTGEVALPGNIEPAEEIAVEVELDMAVISADEPLGLAVTPQAAKPERKLVIVVDDEPDIQRLIVDSLKTLDVEILTASRGVEALQLIKQRRPDLLVLDAMLPEVHGFEICRKVKESKRFGSVPVLMISAIYRGWRIAEDIKGTYKVDEFLEKPFRVAELRRKAEALLAAATPGGKSEEQLSTEAMQAYGEGMDAYQKKQYAEAAEVLRKAEALEPFSAKIQFMLGRVLEQNGRPFQAIYHYERAVELDPKLFPATKNLALLYQSKGFKNKATEMWERSLKAAPSPDVREQIKQHLVSIL